MFRLSISPTVPPLMGRIKPSANTNVSGTKIADKHELKLLRAGLQLPPSG